MANLQQPGKIGELVLKNRMIMAPMGNHIEHGSERTVDYFVARAKGGAAMITCNVMVTDEFEDTSNSLVINAETFDSYKRMVDQSHAYGCKVCAQLMPGCGRIGAPKKYDVPISASAVSCGFAPNVICHELTKEEIEMLKNGFRSTAEYALKAGTDVFEIHAYGGYLTDQFLTKRWNIRTDEYGGDLDGRMKFLIELIDICHEVGGRDFPVIVKFTPDHYLPVEEGYRSMEEGIELAKKLEAHGVSALHIDAGCHDNWYLSMPATYVQDMALQMKASKIVKKHVSIPIIAHGRLRDIAKAESALENHLCDFVMIGRGLLADSELPNKVLAHQVDDIRPCISCNEGCIANVCMGNQVECAINPECGYEGERIITPASEPKKILIIGAGPAGCAAAIYAKEAGHTVEIWEKGTRNGGNALVASKPYFKRDIEDLVRYYEVQLMKLNVPIKYLKEPTFKTVKSFGPDKIIWAAGAIPVRPASIPGINGPDVYTVSDALLNICPVGDTIAIIGGGVVGCEAAVHFATLGKKVMIVEMAKRLLPEPLFIQNQVILEKMIAASDIGMMTGTKLISIEEGQITVADANGKESNLACDTVLLAMGYRPNIESSKVYEEICEVIPVGDCIKAGKIYDAVHQAYNTILKLS